MPRLNNEAPTVEDRAQPVPLEEVEQVQPNAWVAEPQFDCHRRKRSRLSLTLDLRKRLDNPRTSTKWIVSGRLASPALGVDSPGRRQLLVRFNASADGR
jgi:hypothetical protein